MAESFVLSLVACVVGVFAGVAAGRLLGLLRTSRSRESIAFERMDSKARMIAVGVMTRARPRTRRDWALVWGVLVLLAWAVLGSVFLRSR